jgi:hypothetical protein
VCSPWREDNQHPPRPTKKRKHKVRKGGNTGTVINRMFPMKGRRPASPQTHKKSENTKSGLILSSGPHFSYISNGNGKQNNNIL